jgi:FkbM family methyltransferase
MRLSEPMRFRGRIKKWLYGSVPGFAGSFPYFGAQVYFPRNSHLFHRACESGIYEPDLVHQLWTLVRPDTTYFDVGANIGLTSLPVLQCHPRCQVVSFEPSPNTVPYLVRTVRESPYGSRWQLVTKMAGSAVGESKFHLGDQAEGAFDSSQPTGRVQTTHAVTVSVTTLDSEWIARGRPAISVIKIDVEGGESEVLRGAVECVGEMRPFILLEWSEVNLKAHRIPHTDLLHLAGTLRYSILRLPDLIPVQTPGHLRICAAMGIENFLLSPD